MVRAGEAVACRRVIGGYKRIYEGIGGAKMVAIFQGISKKERESRCGRRNMKQ